MTFEEAVQAAKSSEDIMDYDRWRWFEECRRDGRMPDWFYSEPQSKAQYAEYVAGSIAWLAKQAKVNAGSAELFKQFQV